MIQSFDNLYAKMASSSDLEDMHIFGCAMKDMFGWMAKNKPDKAEEVLEKLYAINWDNYLTRIEAETIVNNMEPAPKWTFEQFKRAMTNLGYKTEEEPYYNEYALWAAVSMEYSDHADTIAKIRGAEIKEAVSDEDILLSCYMLATDALKDKDGVFNIRKYFCV